MEQTDTRISQRFMDAVTICGLIGAVWLFIYGYRIGLFTDQAVLEAFMKSVGMWAPFLFIVIQIVQVVIPIIPGGITLAAGVLLFGGWWGFVYNYIGICIGSIIIFFLARKYGKRFVQSIVKEETYNKYIGWLEKGNRFDKLFAVAIFLPMAPDDFLCALAGITKISVKKYIMIILLCKPPSIAAYSLGLTAVIKALLGLVG